MWERWEFVRVYTRASLKQSKAGVGAIRRNRGKVFLCSYPA
jgi:hypothetical protein